MLRLVFSRIVSGLLVVIAVATFSFFMLRAAPGGPFDDDRNLPPAIKHNIEKHYDLDQPVLVQYGIYMKGLLLELDLGHSLKRPQSVREIIAEHFPDSVILGLLALAFATCFGIFFGVVAAARQNSWLDHGAMSVALFGISVPAFVLGPILIMFFSLELGWLPPARFEGFRSMILPALTLGLIYMGVVARLSRTGLLETMRQDYIRTARAKGLPERVVVWKHAVRLGLIPVLTYLGPAAAALITGSFVVEQIFQIPGLGFYFVASISDRDYPVLTGVLVFYSVFLVLLNLAVDIAYGVVDPRIRDRR
ncbi:ABC transporter permease [Haliangium sp.]|uniref:ABC transporter permease n=1 Tax=Haliangium sp. TaxID=2663208 RepID=UPI003D0F4EF1